jgi:hypothetical protein
MKTKLFLTIIIVVLAMPMIATAQTPENKRYISVYEAEEELLGTWDVVRYSDAAGREKLSSAKIIRRFEEKHIYAVSFQDGYFEGEWTVFEYSGEPHIVIRLNGESGVEIYKIVLAGNGVYFVDLVINPNISQKIFRLLTRSPQ